MSSVGTKRWLVGAAAFAAVAVVIAVFSMNRRASAGPDPLWSSDDTFVAASEGTVFGESNSGRLDAFPIDCSEACSPTWTAQVRPDIERSFVDSRVVAEGGMAYVLSPQGQSWNSKILLRAFPIDCDGECTPSWTAVFPKGGPRPVIWSLTPAASGVLLTTNDDRQQTLLFFDARCSENCSASWHAPIGKGNVPFIAATRSSAIVVSANQNPTVYAFPLRCRVEKVGCSPTWQESASRQPARVTATVLADEELFVASDKVRAFDACIPEGRCGPAWSVPLLERFRGVTSYSLATGDGQLAVSRAGTNRDDLVVYPTPCKGKVCSPIWRTGGVSALVFSGDRLIAGSGRPVGVDGSIQMLTDCGDSGDVCAPTWTASIRGWGEEAVADERFVYVMARDLITPIELGDNSIYAFPLECSAECEPEWQLSRGGSLYLEGGRLVVGDSAYSGGIEVFDVSEAPK